MKPSLRWLLLAVFSLLFINAASAHYNPRLGRWLTRDPIGEEGGFNRYAYCGNDPVNEHDPLGLSPNGYQGRRYIRTFIKDPKRQAVALKEFNKIWDESRPYGILGPAALLAAPIAAGGITATSAGAEALLYSRAPMAVYSWAANGGVQTLGARSAVAIGSWVTAESLSSGNSFSDSLQHGAANGLSIWSATGFGAPQFDRLLPTGWNPRYNPLNWRLVSDGVGSFGSVSPRYRGPVASTGIGGQFSPVLRQQKELSELVNRQGAVLDRWLSSSSNKWAQLYRANITSNPNFARAIRGRFLDIRMRGIFQNRFGDDPKIRIDQIVPGSGSNLRPDLYFPSLGGRSVIFDVGSPSKIDDILKYEEMADDIIPLISKQWFK